MVVNQIHSGINILEYKHLSAFYRMMVKRHIKGATIQQLKNRIEKYNQEVLKTRGQYLFYDDLVIKPIMPNWYYILLNGNKFAYNVKENKLYKHDIFNSELPKEVLYDLV